MKTLIKTLLVSALILSGGSILAAGSDENLEKAEKTLQKSVLALDNIMMDPENSIPQDLIGQAEGVVIFPKAFKVALGAFGGQGGRGIAMIRKEDGSWSNPFFVTLGEASFGIQVGAQASDIVLLFKDRNDILSIDEAEITLGGDVGVTAGPVNRGSSASTDIKFDSEIYSYCHSKGLFAGVNLKGGILTYNNSVNESLYSQVNVTSEEILNSFDTPYDENVEELIRALVMYEE